MTHTIVVQLTEDDVKEAVKSFIFTRLQVEGIVPRSAEVYITQLKRADPIENAIYEWEAVAMVQKEK